MKLFHLFSIAVAVIAIAAALALSQNACAGQAPGLI